MKPHPSGETVLILLLKIMKININTQYSKLVSKLVELGWECYYNNIPALLKWQKDSHHLYICQTIDGGLIGTIDLLK